MFGGRLHIVLEFETFNFPTTWDNIDCSKFQAFPKLVDDLVSRSSLGSSFDDQVAGRSALK